MSTFSDPRIAAILEGRRKVAPVPYPGTERDPHPLLIGIRILLDDEIDGARLEAARYVEKKRANIGIDPEFFDRALVREVLSRACVDVDEPEKPFFRSADEVRALDAVQVATLHQRYLDHQDEVNPLVSLTPEQVDDLCDRLGKEQSSAALLSSLDAPTLRSLLRITAARLVSSRPGK